MEDLSVLHSQTRKNLVTPKSIRLAAPQSGFEPGSPGEMTDDLRHYATLGPAPGKIAELDKHGCGLHDDVDSGTAGHQVGSGAELLSVPAA